MSKYVELRTSVTDERYLVEALRELGYEPEVCREGRPLSAIWATNGPSGHRSLFLEDSWMRIQ